MPPPKNPHSPSMASKLLAIASLLSLLYTASASCTFTISNNCPHIIWPGSLAGSGTPQLPWTGFKLDPGNSVRIPAPPGWSGRIWARTGCKFDKTGAGTCQTGDCGGKMQCNGMGALPPATLFEITLGKGKDQDFYDVSLVDGYNLPIYAAPRGQQGLCNATGCSSDLNASKKPQSLSSYSSQLHQINSSNATCYIEGHEDDHTQHSF